MNSLLLIPFGTVRYGIVKGDLTSGAADGIEKDNEENEKHDPN